MTEKLQKIIAAAGICSRRRAEELISAGRVEVNGFVAMLGDRADAQTDAITLDGQPISAQNELVYYILHKPTAVVTSMKDEKGRPDLRRYTAGVDSRLFPVGRLDMDSSGLLIMTNDGDFANRVAHPSREIVKAYRVRVSGFTQAALAQLSEPIELDGETVQADYVRLISRGNNYARLLIGIHQGKNRQVRRMCAACGMNLTELKRVAVGALLLGDIAPGAFVRIDRETAERVFETITADRLM